LGCRCTATIGGLLALRWGGLLGAALFAALLALVVGSSPITLQFNTDTTGAALMPLALMAAAAATH